MSSFDFDTLDCSHDLSVQVIHNTASLIYWYFHITVENVQYSWAEFVALVSMGSNVLTG
jgi:hypothetical protein